RVLCLRLCDLGGFFLFFFSSRRRHTSSLRDWSSDVCSSDLRTTRAAGRPLSSGKSWCGGVRALRGMRSWAEQLVDVVRLRRHERSEERRVGKEWKTRGSPSPPRRTRTPQRPPTIS